MACATYYCLVTDCAPGTRDETKQGYLPRLVRDPKQRRAITFFFFLFFFPCFLVLSFLAFLVSFLSLLAFFVLFCFLFSFLSFPLSSFLFFVSFSPIDVCLSCVCVVIDTTCIIYVVVFLGWQSEYLVSPGVSSETYAPAWTWHIVD